MAETTAVQCPECRAINRVPVDKIKRGKKAVCGRCATPLPITAAPMTVTDATFAADVERSPLPVLVDMWAPWCGPCHAVAPMIDELAAEMTGRVRFAKMNVDDNPTTASRFAVRSIPTLLVLHPHAARPEGWPRGRPHCRGDTQVRGGGAARAPPRAHGIGRTTFMKSPTIRPAHSRAVPCAEDGETAVGRCSR